MHCKRTERYGKFLEDNKRRSSLPYEIELKLSDKYLSKLKKGDRLLIESSKYGPYFCIITSIEEGVVTATFNGWK